MGQGVRLVVGEALASLSIGRTSLEDLSPQPPIGEARGLPLALGAEAPRPVLATTGLTDLPGDGAGHSQRQ